MRAGGRFRARCVAWPRALAAAAILLLSALGGAGIASAQATDPPTCRKVRLADVGWTAESATTAVVAQILTELGYQPVITVLSVPVTFESMKNGDMDVFLANWLPTQEPMLKPYLADGSIKLLRANLVGAKYTLAVPDYLYDAGLKDFKDINKFRKELGASIYGIEPGNDGNELILDMIKKNEFGLAGFKVVESSEQGMLAQVERAVRKKAPVVFLAWAPHPMNTHYPLRYLTGGDATFGPNYGAATVNTLARKGYTEACPNLGRLLANLQFDVDLENKFMDRILTDKVSAADLAREWVATRPARMTPWLQGVVSFDGRPALDVLQGQGQGQQVVRVRGLGDGAQDSGRRHRDALRRLHEETRERFLRRHRSRAHRMHPDRVSAAQRDAGAAADPRHRRALIRAAPLSRPGRVRGGVAAVHHEPGLLGRDARDADARAGRGAHRDGGRRAARHRGRASARGCRRRCVRCST